MYRKDEICVTILLGVGQTWPIFPHACFLCSQVKLNFMTHSFVRKSLRKLQ